LAAEKSDGLFGAMPGAALEIHYVAELMKKMRQILRKPK
jgi:hypothetical protein